MRELITIVLVFFVTGLKAQNENLERVLDQVKIGIDSFKNSYNEVYAKWDNEHRNFFHHSLDSTRDIYIVPIVCKVYDQFTYDLDNHIIIVDKGGNLICHFYESSRWETSALHISKIELKDIYSISENAMAIGIEVSFEINGFVLAESSEYSLYKIDNKQIKNILKNFLTYDLKGEPQFWPEDKPHFRKLNRDLNILPTRTNGYYDIEVKNIVKKSEDWNNNDEPKNNSIQVLRFDNRNQIYKLFDK